MFVNPQDGRASRRVPLGKLALEPMAEIAFHGGGSNPLAPADAAAIDPVEVLPEDRLTVRFTGSLAVQNARQTLAELPSAVQAKPFPRLHSQTAVPQTQILMSH
jgi:hypothetical protein